MTRKALLFLAVSSLCGALTAPLCAQALDPIARFDIPFEFTVSRQTLPAGEYTVRLGASTGMLLIQSQGDRPRAAFSASFPAGNAIGNQCTLTFHRYGDQFFLSRISQGGGYPVRGLHVSPAERKLAKAPSPGRFQAVILAALPTRR